MPLYKESYASDFEFEPILLHMVKNRRLHLVASCFQKKFTIEINYEIHNKELFAIVDSFQEWRHLLEGASYIVIVCILQNLKYSMIVYVWIFQQAY